MASLILDSEEIIQLSHHEFLKIDKDYEEAATVANLIYVTDDKSGIKRIKKGKGFTYIFDDKPLKDKEQIERIRKLAIPPAWTNVWICHLPNGHIQATGFDLRQRKQYKYLTCGIRYVIIQNSISCMSLEKHFPNSGCE